jgi:RHS repeat-associated protein
MSVSHTYDAAGRETVLENRKSDGTALAVYTATHDARGDRLTVLELDGDRVTYAYDAVSQLTQEQRSGGNAYDTSYQYDPVGNRLVKDDGGELTTYTYNVADELTLVEPPTGQPTTMTWDANGSLHVENAGGELTTYTWDDEDRLIGIAHPDGTLDTHTYAPNRLRHRKETSEETTLFVWDGQNVLMETDEDLATQAQYTDSPGYWGGLVSQRRGDATSYYGFDMQGSTRMLVSAAQAITDTYDFRAFGEELAASGSTDNPLRYVGSYGYYRDAGGRLYVRARYLATPGGRWISRDPLADLVWQLMGTRHRTSSGVYAYADLNPLALVDPSGLLASEEHCARLADAVNDAAASASCTLLNDLLYEYLHDCLGVVFPPCPSRSGCPPRPSDIPWLRNLPEIGQAYDAWLDNCHCPAFPGSQRGRRPPAPDDSPGIRNPRPGDRPAVPMTPEECQDRHAANLMACYHCCAALPRRLASAGTVWLGSPDFVMNCQAGCDAAHLDPPGGARDPIPGQDWRRWRPPGRSRGRGRGPIRIGK